MNQAPPLPSADITPLFQPLPMSYYDHPDVVHLSRDLLGKHLYTTIDGVTCGGRIIETEAYQGPEDKASHAYRNRRTPRTEAMFTLGGHTYVYLCYGIHALLNIVTHKEGIPHAVLIRAIEPLVGLPMMLTRRRRKRVDRSVAGGPGMVTQALGITLAENRLLLSGERIWIEDHGEKIHCPLASPRVGVDYAEEWACKPWRFRVAEQ